ncbi:hypothetical protein OG444_40285 (plasmid) [Streptomyces sp. NBC_01232]|uniref:hypothetical protein n=1 Tax=Streptomyces sp. NBC_01232 TaxID=2903786 RepID=UPI002E0F0EFB|nr:hypothetical protein OG444_40285 [Streptomyces sp. NBC_01232]
MAASLHEMEQRHRSNLEAFVLRARRVEKHSLAADWEGLVALGAGSLKVTVTGEQAVVRQELPPEELVESAAARVRPLLLEEDPCSYLKALAAVGYFCRHFPGETGEVKAKRAEWQARTKPAADSGYTVMVANTTTGQTASLTDHDLAWAWIYGDVVHHDPKKRREADPFGLAERFRAAVPLVTWAMVAAIELLNHIRALQHDAILGLSPDVLDQEVVLRSTTWEHTAQALTAPPGTPAPEHALSPFPRGWTSLQGTAAAQPIRSDVSAASVPD